MCHEREKETQAPGSAVPRICVWLRTHKIRLSEDIPAQPTIINWLSPALAPPPDHLDRVDNEPHSRKISQQKQGACGFEQPIGIITFHRL
jgi:hypothetical protein